MSWDRCENTTALWFDKDADPSWITFDQIFGSANLPPEDLSSTKGEPITFVRGQAFEANQYHYFEFIVSGGDGLIADDVRRDALYLSLVSPASIRVSTGNVVVVSGDAAKKPAYDFYVGQNCVPQEGAWNNQGYGNVNADEKIKSVYVNVTRDGRYFIALQSRKIRYGVAAFDYTMKLSRGSLVSKYPSTRCTPLTYRCLHFPLLAVFTALGFQIDSSELVHVANSDGCCFHKALGKQKERHNVLCPCVVSHSARTSVTVYIANVACYVLL